MSKNLTKPDFEIRNIDDWAHFCADLSLHGEGKVIHQVDDLDFSAVQACQYVPNFNGSYEGGSFSIKNYSLSKKLNINVAGIFSVIGVEGKVSDLFLHNIDICGITDAGGVAGECQGKISSISLDDIQIHSERGSAGGVTGTLKNGTIERITACNITIKGTLNSGGVFGDGTSIQVDRCNLTDIKIKGRHAGGVGGFINNGVIDACVVKTLKVISRRISYYMGSDDNCIGGIAGYSSGKVSACFVEGLLSGNDEKDVRAIIGGIIGVANGEVADCHAFGIEYKGSSLGGIVGKDTEEQLQIERCFVVGLKTARVTFYLGGILGKSNNRHASIDSCVFYSDSFLAKNGEWLIADTQQVKNCWAMRVPDATEDHNVKNGQRLSAAQAGQQRFYEMLGWDFDSMWKMDKATGLPALRFNQPEDDVVAEPSDAFPRSSVEEINQQVRVNIWLGGGSL